MPLHSVADRTLWFLKWPVALAAIAVLPGAVAATWKVPLTKFIATPKQVAPFLIGFAAYMAAWAIALRRRSFGSYFSTLEHELTHAFFAVITFHKVVGLRTSWSEGGSMKFKGEGNWLISTGPYFLPGFSFVAAAALALVPQEYRAWAGGVLGATVAYHITSTYRETHGGQKDLEVVGWPFAAAFLPAANILCYGLVLAFVAGGPDSVAEFVKQVGRQTRELAARFF